MIITLSEERNEKLLCEWSGEITDEHAQDFCDVCNAVFSDHFDLDYIRRKYEANIYGKSFIAVLYKDGVPVAAEGAWRNDIDGRPSFQICDTATLPAMRKRGYNTAIAKTIISQARQAFPNGQIYRFSGPMSHHMSELLGFARTNLYLNMSCRASEDFLANVPVIDDAYADTFLNHKKGVHLLRINTYWGGGHYFLAKKLTLKHVVPAAIVLGQVSSSYEGKFRRLSRCRFLLYYSRKRGILGDRYIARIGKYDLCRADQVMDFVPPMYKSDGNSLDFNNATPKS